MLNSINRYAAALRIAGIKVEKYPEVVSRRRMVRNERRGFSFLAVQIAS